MTVASLRRPARTPRADGRCALPGARRPHRFAGMVALRMYAAGDAAATSGHLAAHRDGPLRRRRRPGRRRRLVLLALVLDWLLADARPGAARAMVVFTAIGAGIMMLNAVFEFEAMRVATGALDLSALGAGGSNALALLLLDTHQYGVFVAQVFFGLWLLPLGYLAWRSAGMLPKWLGAVLIAGGACYLVDLLLAFLAPDLWRDVHGAVVAAAAVTEVTAVAYLLVIGARLPVSRRPALAGM